MFVHLRTTSKKLLHVRMIVGLRQDARDYTPLLGHTHALGGAKRLDILLLDVALARGGHDSSLESREFTGFAISYWPCQACVHRALRPSRAAESARWRPLHRFPDSNRGAARLPESLRADIAATPAYCA